MNFIINLISETHNSSERKKIHIYNISWVYNNFSFLYMCHFTIVKVKFISGKSKNGFPFISPQKKKNVTLFLIYVPLYCDKGIIKI